MLVELTVIRDGKEIKVPIQGPEFAEEGNTFSVFEDFQLKAGDQIKVSGSF